MQIKLVLKSPQNSSMGSARSAGYEWNRFRHFCWLGELIVSWWTLCVLFRIFMQPFNPHQGIKDTKR